MKTKPYYFPFSGGLNVVSPALAVAAGELIAVDNYEPYLNGGYKRVSGFERYDGRKKPSEAKHYGLNVVDASGFSVGNTVTGVTSGATAVIIEIDVNELIITDLNGSFVDGESIGGTFVDGELILSSSPNETERQRRRLLAANYYRDLIQPLAGNGDVRGAFAHKDKIFAWRDDGAVCKTYLATLSGWVEQNTAVTIVRFTGSDTEFAEGAAFATASGSGTVHRSILHSGAYGTSDAKGYVALINVTGSFADAEAITGTTAACDGAGYVHSQLAGGRYQCISANFYGGDASYRVYGCDGINPAFELDNNGILTPILMEQIDGAPEFNKPYLVAKHFDHLALMFPSGSMQLSIAGDPLVYNGFLGAAEFGLGAEGTGLTSIAGGVLVMHTNRDTQALYGRAGAFEKKVVSDESGATLYSVAEMGGVYSYAQSGITALARTQQFGDMASASVSSKIEPILRNKQHLCIGSAIIKSTNQYRLFFSDGRAVTAYQRLDGQFEFTEINYEKDFSFVSDGEDQQGKQVIFAGGSDGYVYQLESGINFDGQPIVSNIRFPYAHLGSPSHFKKFRLALIDMETPVRASFRVSTDLSYGNDASPWVGSQDSGTWIDSLEVGGGGGFWDTDNWDEIYFDAPSVSQLRVELSGSGINIGIALHHDSATTPPFVLQGATIHYDLRRLRR